MIEEGNKHMKTFLVILGASLFIGGFYILLTVYSVDETFTVVSVLVFVGSIIGLTIRKK
jgi:hypothetical protein